MAFQTTEISFIFLTYLACHVLLSTSPFFSVLAGGWLQAADMGADTRPWLRRSIVCGQPDRLHVRVKNRQWKPHAYLWSITKFGSDLLLFFGAYGHPAFWTWHFLKEIILIQWHLYMADCRCDELFTLQGADWLFIRYFFICSLLFLQSLPGWANVSVSVSIN
jgi:hypothetical protein